MLVRMLVHEQDFYDLAWAYFEKCAEDRGAYRDVLRPTNTY